MGRFGAARGKVTLADWETLRYVAGRATVQAHAGTVRLALGGQEGVEYCDAQLDDYSVDGVLRWQPPVCLSLRARFSHPTDALQGTLGFGFWNDPLQMTTNSTGKWGIPTMRLPQAAWFFFAASPSNLPWAYAVPGIGWKAATLDASRGRVRLLLPFAPIAMLMCRLPGIYTRLWPWIQSLLKIDEKLLSTQTHQWHEYRLLWDVGEVRFWVDEAEVFCTSRSPQGPLGLVIWIDNQFMVATPQGILRHGLVSSGEQWLEIASLEVSHPPA